jgi:hypothetical protein
MVRAMYIAMTIQAGLAEDVLICPRGRDTESTAHSAGMKLSQVALLAKLRRPLVEHARVHRAVRLVAGGAVLAHWRVFPQKRPARLGVTVVAGFIDAKPPQI